MTREIRGELRQEHLESKAAQARLEGLRLEVKAKARAVSLRRIVWEDRREVREARMRLKHKLDLERRAVRHARIRGLAANGFSTTEIPAEVGETRGLVWAVFRPAAVAVGDRLGDRCRGSDSKSLSCCAFESNIGG